MSPNNFRRCRGRLTTWREGDMNIYLRTSSMSFASGDLILLTVADLLAPSTWFEARIVRPIPQKARGRPDGME